MPTLPHDLDESRSDSEPKGNYMTRLPDSKRGTAMPHRQVYIEQGGRRFAGSYEVQGDKVSVSSAYGSQSGQLRRRQPEKLAATLLSGIVADYCKARAH